MTDTSRSTPGSPGEPGAAGRPPAAANNPHPASGTPAETPATGAHPAPGPAPSGRGPAAPPPPAAGKTTGPDAPPGTGHGDSSGRPVYGPPGTGPAPEEPVYGYQTLGTGIPGRLDIGHALSYGLEKFRLNFGPWVAVTSLGLIIYLLFTLVVRIVEPRSMLALLVLFAAVMAGLWVLQAALVRGALYETDGYRPGFGSYFYFGNLGNAFLTALLAFLATTLASALCLVPGILVGIGCMFSLHFAMEQGQTPVEAIKSSFLLVLQDPWRVFLLVLTVIVITVLGLLACGFGLLAAGPVAAIAVTYAYRTLTGGPISPV
ncbi:DUF2189 domain-containing protein [Nocardia sp. X0981]